MRKRQRKRQRMSGGKKKKGGRALITFIDSLPDIGREKSREKGRKMGLLFSAT